MEMMKILTQKLKQQSLNEAQSFQPSKVEEDRDSGTESDEEIAEIEALEQEVAMLEQQENQENGTPPPLMIPVATRCGSPVRYSVSKRPLQLANQPASIQAPRHHQDQNSDLSQHSSHASSDYERCSLDYDPSSSNEFDRHSSEEELAVINCTTSREVVREKRTWSQANYHDYCGSCHDGLNSSGSSDEEVKDLLSLSHDRPLLFSSSPPKGVRRLSKTLSPRLFLQSVSYTNAVSPRKRHRQTLARDVSDVSNAVIQRPCLDFEKMQVSSYFPIYSSFL